jgi:hypothetical protein
MASRPYSFHRGFAAGSRQRPHRWCGFQLWPPVFGNASVSITRMLAPVAADVNPPTSDVAAQPSPPLNQTDFLVRKLMTERSSSAR